MLRNRTTVAGLVGVLGLIVMAVTAPVLAPYDPLAMAPLQRLDPPGATHPFGQDDYGRDILSRVMWGSRISLLVGVLSVGLGALLGSALGIVAGYRGGKVESAIMRLADVMLAFPDLITGLLVLAVLGPGLERMVLAIGIVISPTFVRLAHAPTLALKRRLFVEAAYAIGLSDLRVLRLHILPNLVGELIVMASLWIANAIRIEASLSFIGLGVPPPTPTWGQMIRDGTVHLTSAPWFSVLPGLAIVLAVLSFNLLGDGLRDAFDPKTQE